MVYKRVLVEAQEPHVKIIVLNHDGNREGAPVLVSVDAPPEVADLATRPQNIDALQNAGVMALLRPLLLDNVASASRCS